MKFIAAAFVFLTCMTLLFTTEVTSARLQLRCPCIKMYSGKPINPKLIQKVQMIPAGAQCKNVAIIATLKNGQTCLNPKDEWVKKIIKG
ncbi:interleukin-8-like isoform X1 [Sinocyclocheilus rhinocerous]|uniref:interleukin-8-like isoform X1 n=1 Tax=Sinocyclocheilus rhinocerous TaxID=307959 RepID=UPI0007B80478|nr:PREDICTED: interleukin-8-like isoform X1 [Sinocyclocheilus rhinocerous]